MKKFAIFILLVASLLLAGCNSKETTTNVDKETEGKKIPLTVSAAVSLTEALEEIKELYEKDHTVDITLQLGGSGTLARQIQQGAPVDIFLSANQEWMDTLEKEDLINRSTRANITGNKMVMITSADSDIQYTSAAQISAKDVEQIAIGNPKSVPAGKYTEEALHHLNKWNELKDQLVLAKDVRQVLTYVETGNADIGFVYESDAVNSDKIKMLATVDDSLHGPIVYPGAVIANTKHEKEAEDFLTFLQTEEAQNIMKKYGFKK
ncbi:molybdate transport system substrate-binding protein [Bacillus thermophilus]|uniref:Molybdate transport system substrate-binding protein n=1 Tax=Siminovitchia thermophila TaxID=1245522 RepID=A0ABS2R5K7_9BACI|nr:molybdate ABC transporter substrate-binding protein [Siminovitchia thermophila]MBM7714878.1 molybdate transport system substrate-binding protein [Siminovitchia thermophila]ONK21761.1 molybdate ABC transporter substrate-binding protein [Bacillus sp. VT-16-64]